jgi:hypothetical protein
MHEEEQRKLEIFSDGKNLKFPPEPDEIEVSVFGPGYGECVAVHSGRNNWFIVDSCIDTFTRKPAALVYFEKIDVDPSVAVKQLIATHWHDDHIRGFSKLLDVCKSAQLVCSTALNNPEFRELVCCYGTRSMLESSGIDEFRDVFETLKKRKETDIGNYTPVFAGQDRRIWESDSEVFGSPAHCEIFSLSPSDSTILASMLGFADLLPRSGDTKRWLPAISPNRAAVVIWLKVAHFSILLGSDLEEHGEPDGGWSIIVNSHSPQRGKASIFKIPHHGSVTAHHPGVCADMLDANPIAVLTPFLRGGILLPTKNDTQRITSSTRNAFVTCGIPTRSIKRDRTTERTIKEAVKDIRTLFGPSGPVRIRLQRPDMVKVELFGDAKQLQVLST